MVVRAHSGSQTVQTSSRRVALRGLLNSDLYDSMYIIIYDMDLYFGIYEGKHHYGGGHGNAA